MKNRTPRLAGLVIEAGGTCYYILDGPMRECLEIGARTMRALEAENADPILTRGDRRYAIRKRALAAQKESPA